MWNTLLAVLTSSATLLAGPSAGPAPVLPGRAANDTAVRMVLPAPTGPERIGTVSLHLVDGSRADPWVPAERARQLMVQIWYPAVNVRAYPRAGWVSPGVAEWINPPGSGFILPVTHGHTGAPAAPGRRPVVLYSPGFGLERTGSTALVEDLASRGYVVVTVDHTYDGQFVEFPDGRIATHAIPQPTSPEEADRLVDKLMAVRVADTRFVLDKLATISRGRNRTRRAGRCRAGCGSSWTCPRSACSAPRWAAPRRRRRCWRTDASGPASTWTARSSATSSPPA